jgi:plasmid stabilization system protein ParE
MRVSLVSPAEEELGEAVRFYEERRAGLGLEFLDAYEATIARVRERPEAWRVFSPGFRRCLFERFPFALIYRVTESEIIVLAVMHLRREPGYWRARL